VMGAPSQSPCRRGSRPQVRQAWRRHVILMAVGLEQSRLALRKLLHLCQTRRWRPRRPRWQRHQAVLAAVDPKQRMRPSRRLPEPRRTRRRRLRGPRRRRGRVALALLLSGSAPPGPVRAPSMLCIFEDFLFLPLFLCEFIDPCFCFTGRRARVCNTPIFTKK
jgi:hypothetical protein